MTSSSGDASFTEPATPSPNDPGKAFAPLGTIPEQRNSSGDTTVGQTREIVSEKALPELPPHGIHSWIRKIRLPRLPFFRARDYNDGTSSGQSMSNSGRLMNKPPSSHGSKPSATSLNGRSSAQLPYFPGGSLV
ncbi:hypothetical protein MMC20_002726 [Loxospora ochrophaea]|nr:hypothetical protein [Loxospora ochrophaea]